MSDEIFDDKERLEVTNGIYTAILFNRKIAPIWIINSEEEPGWEIIFNPFIEGNKDFVLDEIDRKEFKVDKRKTNTDVITSFIKSKSFGRVVIREYKKWLKEKDKRRK